MTTSADDTTARDAALVKYAETLEPGTKVNVHGAFCAGYDAALRAQPEPVGDRGEARARFELIRHRIVSLMTDLKLQFDAAALAPPPAVPDEVRRLSDAARPGQWFEQRSGSGADKEWYLASLGGYKIANMADPDAKVNAEFVATLVNWLRSLRAAPAQPAEDGERNDYASTHLVLDRYGVPRDVNGGQLLLEERVATLKRRIRELEEALRDVLHRALADEHLLSNEERNMVDRARAILKGDGK